MIKDHLVTVPKDRLAYVLAPIVVLCVAGAVYVAMLALGWYSWGAVIVSGIAGLISLPLAWVIADYIRRTDPDWPPRRRNN